MPMAVPPLLPLSDAHLAAVAAGRSPLAPLLDALVARHVGLVASWSGPSDTTMTVHDFLRPDGTSFIPLFTSAETAREQLRGSGFEDRAVTMDGRVLARMFAPDQLLVLNPASGTPLAFPAAELHAAGRRADDDPGIHPVPV